jgi:hypothetical protein
LIGFHFLFLGFSFTDPNIGHLLGLIRESMGDSPTQHYAIVRKPKKGSGPDADRLYQYAKSRHAHWIQDMQRYTINCVEVDEYEDIESTLKELEGNVARHSIFVSGSYPEKLRDDLRTRIEEVAIKVGEFIGERGLRLISGFGTVVGSSVVSGVLSKLYANEAHALDRTLFLRPFPQVVPDGFDKQTFQQRYREDMITHAGICVFIGGMKEVNGSVKIAPGVLAEYEIAKALKKTIIPVAATGGAAAEIWAALNADGGDKVANLPEEIFRKLGIADASLSDAIVTVIEAIKSVLLKR